MFGVPSEGVYRDGGSEKKTVLGALVANAFCFWNLAPQGTR